MVGGLSRSGGVGVVRVVRLVAGMERWVWIWRDGKGGSECGGVACGRGVSRSGGVGVVRVR